MTIRLFSVIVILTLSCKTKKQEWQTLDFGIFKLTTPHGWSIIKENGVDSYYGGMTNGKDTLWFSYSWQGTSLNGEDTIQHRFTNDTINGLFATVMIPEEPGKGYVYLNFPNVSNGKQLTMWGKEIAELDTVLNIYKSVLFKNSNPSINPPLTASKFTLLSNGGTPKSLFQQKCGICHAVDKKILSAPPMSETLGRRSTDWIYRFITDWQSVVSDPAHKVLLKEYKHECVEYPSFEKQELELMVNYVKRRIGVQQQLTAIQANE